MEEAARNILKRAIDLDIKKKYSESLICYQEGIQLLINLRKKANDASTQNYYRIKIEEYMSRAEELKLLINTLKEQGLYHEQISIENNSTGHSYKTIFKRFLDESINEIKIEDPYIRLFHQVQNLVIFCEMLTKKCKNLKHIYLITSYDSTQNEQQKWLNELKDNLLKYNINLHVSYSMTLHDRKISLSNGWIVKIGRGLDYFKKPNSRISLGASDFDFRQCHETTVDIFHQKNVKQSFG